MKAVIPVAIIGALMISPAFGAGMDKSSASGTDMRTQSSMSRQDSQTVMQVQQQLKQQGYDVGSVDGKMGPRTKQALRSYQRDKNITGNGDLNQQTISSLGVSAGMNQRAESPAIRGSTNQQAETPAMRGSTSGTVGVNPTDRMMNSSGGNVPGGSGITSTPGAVPGGGSTVPGGTGSGSMGSGVQQGPSPRSDSLPTPANR